MIVKKVMIALAILAIVATGCAPKPTVPDLAAMQLQVQQTLDFENAVQAQLTQVAQSAQPPTLEPPTQSPPTVQPTSSVPMLSVSKNSNCREGPDSTIWKSIGNVMVGDRTQIVAKYNKGGWYIVKNPSYPSETCWVWDFYATVEGDTSLLPLATTPPKPTPKP